jgi:hypothetical protein
MKQRKRKTKKTKLIGHDPKPEEKKFYSTLDFKDTGLTTARYDTQRVNTLEDEKSRNLYEIESMQSPRFYNETENKEHVIMSCGNTIANLESLVKELEIQRRYLTETDLAKGNTNIVEKINQYRQLIESQILSTLSLSSFKYLKESINDVIGKNNQNNKNYESRHMSQNSMESTQHSFRTKTKKLMSPERSNYLNNILSQSNYHKNAKLDQKQNPHQKISKHLMDPTSDVKEKRSDVKPKIKASKTEFPNMFSKYKVMNPNDIINKTNVTKNQKKTPERSSKKAKSRTKYDVNTKIVDMRQKNVTLNITKDLVSKRKVKTRKHQSDCNEQNKYQDPTPTFKNKKSSMPINIISENLDLENRQIYNNNHLTNSTH